MSHSSQVEIERKYDVDQTAHVPDLVGAGTIAVAEAAEVIELTAVYFDTDAFDLAASRIALRRREGGNDAGWHIKQPTDEGRTELHWPLGADVDQPPADLSAHIAQLIDGRPLQAIARVENRRVNRRLLDAAGYPVAEVSDDHVHARNLLDGSEREWREWEIELLAAAPDSRKGRYALLDEIEGSVVSAGGRPSVSSSKLARALGLDALA